MRSVSLLLCALLPLAGCGQRGALYLPEERSTAVQKNPTPGQVGEPIDKDAAANKNPDDKNPDKDEADKDKTEKNE